MNIALGMLRRVQCDPAKTPYVIDRIIDSQNKRHLFGSKIHKAERGLASACGYMHLNDSLSATLKIGDDSLELSVKRERIQILRVFKSAKADEIAEALSSPLFPLLDDPEAAIEEAENCDWEEGVPKGFEESIARWKRLARSFKKVPKRHRKMFQFKIPSRISARLAEETCSGLMLCPFDANYDPAGDHANDDVILLNRADSVRAWIMEAANTNSEIVLESSHKDIERLLVAGGNACDALTHGFAKLMTISKGYLQL